MTISEVHFQFAKDVDYLNNPQKYLGPATNKVLKFWSNLDKKHPLGPHRKQVFEYWRKLENLLNGVIDSHPPKTISETLFSIAKKKKNVEIINNPQNYFGPHTNQLLHFWNKLDDLTKDQWYTITYRYRAFRKENYSEWDKAEEVANKASKEMISDRLENHAPGTGLSVFNSHAAYYASQEIIGGVENPTFLKMFDNL